jgi:hypothetical protein
LRIERKQKKYPDFYEVTGYGEMLGLCGINCRHSFFFVDPEVDKPVYTKKELAEIANKEVKYKGKMYSIAHISQMQRYFNRQLAKYNRFEVAYKAIGNQDLAAQARVKINGYRKKLRSLVKIRV